MDLFIQFAQCIWHELIRACIFSCMKQTCVLCELLFSQVWRNHFLPDPAFIYWTPDGPGAWIQHELRMSRFCLYNECHTDRATYLQGDRMWLSGVLFLECTLSPAPPPHLHPRPFSSYLLLYAESYGLPSVSTYSLHVNKVLDAPKKVTGSSISMIRSLRADQKKICCPFWGDRPRTPEQGSLDCVWLFVV